MFKLACGARQDTRTVGWSEKVPVKSAARTLNITYVQISGVAIYFRFGLWLLKARVTEHLATISIQRIRVLEARLA